MASMASRQRPLTSRSSPVPRMVAPPGTGLGRDSEIATQGEKRDGAAWPAFEERSFEAFRSYYDYVPKGVLTLQYTLRLNNAGNFALPPTRVEAMYAPEMFGEAPNARMKVEAAKIYKNIFEENDFNFSGTVSWEKVSEKEYDVNVIGVRLTMEVEEVVGSRCLYD